MSNRCPSCEKFVSLEVGEPDLTPEIDTETARLTGRIHLDCSDCGEEMKEWDIDLDEDIPKDAAKHLEENMDHSLNIDFASDPEVNDEYRPRRPPKRRKDGTIPRVPMRYQTHYYALNATCKVTCDCGEEFDTIEFADEIEASGMNELN